MGLIKRFSTITSFVCVFKASEGRASFKKGQSSQFTGALAEETKLKVQFGERNRNICQMGTRVERCCSQSSARVSEAFVGFAERKSSNIPPMRMKMLFLCGIYPGVATNSSFLFFFTPPKWRYYGFHYYNLNLHLSSCLQPLEAGVICPPHHCSALASFEITVDIH